MLENIVIFCYSLLCDDDKNDLLIQGKSQKKAVKGLVCLRVLGIKLSSLFIASKTVCSFILSVTEGKLRSRPNKFLKSTERGNNNNNNILYY